MHSKDFLNQIGVIPIGPASSPFDPGYDVNTLTGHLEQSAHLISILKLSMACWLLAGEASTRRKIEVARSHRVPTVTGGGPFEIAVQQDQWLYYLDLCADFGFSRIECGQGFTEMSLSAAQVLREAKSRGLEVQLELGKKHDGAFDKEVLRTLIEQGCRWIDEGAEEVVVEARESALDVGLFDERGALNKDLADKFVEAFGIKKVTFEAPNKSSQFALLNHLGPEVRLSNIRLEELLRVEIYRRGIHSDAFSQPKLRPQRPR